jgi:hypothetical protein
MHASVRRPLLALALLALPALAVAGCGGDDSSSGGTTTVTALTADQWREQADAICKDIDAKTDAIAQPTGPADIQAFLEAGIPIGQEQITRLKALVPPTELESIQTQAVANQEEGLKVIQSALDRIKGGEDATKVVTELQADIERIQEEGRKLAKDAGLEICGGEGSGTTSTDSTTTESSDTETTTTLETPTIPTTGDAQVDKFLADVQKATGALTAFGNALSSVSNPEEIKSQATALRGQLGDFDSAISAMDGYTLDNATVEGQRSRLVTTGPKVSDVLRRFIDAGSTGDLVKITAILPEVATALQDFTKAAQPQ